ncbi:hypothetical protein [Burkholderia sp. SIMBA_062]|uniref:hypothetical protein n=1 Tax=Burkholderia sp. SIMBA_062 TaxID=3085803 RepID=UPI00397DC895
MDLNLPIHPPTPSVLHPAPGISDRPVKVSDVPRNVDQFQLSQTRSLQQLQLIHVTLMKVINRLSVITLMN